MTIKQFRIIESPKAMSKRVIGQGPKVRPITRIKGTSTKTKVR